MHETRIKVRSTQLDAFGHLNHAAFLEILEWARWEWAEEAGLSGRDLVRAAGRGEPAAGPAVVHLEVDYRREVGLHDELTVQTRLVAANGVKGTIRQRVLLPDGTLACEARVVFVMFDLVRRRATRIPPEMRALVEPE